MPSFKKGLCDCCASAEACLFAYCIPGVSGYLIAKHVDQNKILWGIITCCIPMVGAICLRENVRKKRNIDVNI